MNAATCTKASKTTFNLTILLEPQYKKIKKKSMQTNGPKGKMRTGLNDPCIHARHLPHNNIENMDTLYYISQYNKQHTKKQNNQTEARQQVINSRMI
jgi:hypothetical protein